VAVIGVGLLVPGARAEPVEEWQVRGTLAALKDGYPQVRLLALSELADLLRPESPHEWQGRSMPLLDEARGDLRGMLSDSDAEVRAAAGRALALLDEHRKDAAALRELLHDPNAHAGIHAAQSLARLYETAGDVAGLRDLLRDPEPNAPWAAAQALARLHQKANDAAALRALLDDSDRNVRWYAGQALARVYERSKDAASLRALLKDGNPDVRREAAVALARLGEKDAESVLRDVLHDKDASPDVRREAAEALTRLRNREGIAALREYLKDPRNNVREQSAEALVAPHERGKDTPGLRDLLRDPSPEVREKAAQALAHLAETARDRTALRDLLQSSDPDAAREAAWALVRLAQTEGDRTALREMLQSPDPAVSREAVWALGRLGDKDVIPTLREMLKDPNSDARRETALVLTRLGDADLLTVLRIPYEDTSYLPWARWLAHYWGGRRPEVARVLCAYLGRPMEPPLPPVSESQTRRDGVLADIRVLREEAWEKTDSFWMKEDVARWWSWLITQEGVSWRGADEAELKRVRGALGNEPFGPHYAAAIDRALEPLDTSPSPLIRTGLVVVLLNVIAVLLTLLGRRLGGRARWLPLGVCLLAVVAVVVSDAGGWGHRLRTIPWLLGLVALVEVSVLAGVGSRSAGGAGIGRLPRFARRSGGSRAALESHAAAVAARLRDDRDRAGYEEYIPLPADVRSESHPAPAHCAEPAAAILARLTSADGPRGNVLIEAPAGTGKSALLREVVSRALDRFKADPATGRLPVLLAGGGESVEAMTEAALAPLLSSQESLGALLTTGRFVLVLDGVSESGPCAEVLAAFVNGPHGATTPLLIAARPGHGFGRALRGDRWMTVAPKALDAESLGKFTAAYAGSPPPDSILTACRGPDGGYLPRLVRMAMVVSPRADAPISAASLYRDFFLRSLEGQLPAEAERIKRLDEASRWCLETYWRDGLRLLRHDPTDPLQRSLRQAGLLVAVGAGPNPNEVVFADATMQSYLTAHGLAAQDRQGYKQLPRPTDDTNLAPWDRARVLLRAAADSELFRLCLATFTPKKDVREWLRDELRRWADGYADDLPRRKVLAAVPSSLAGRLGELRGARNVLVEATRAAFESDEVADSTEALGSLYAGVAPLVRDLEPVGSGVIQSAAS
jgi:HEAT repeat protein